MRLMEEITRIAVEVKGRPRLVIEAIDDYDVNHNDTVFLDAIDSISTKHNSTEENSLFEILFRMRNSTTTKLKLSKEDGQSLLSSIENQVSYELIFSEEDDEEDSILIPKVIFFKQEGEDYVVNATAKMSEEMLDLWHNHLTEDLELILKKLPGYTDNYTVVESLKS